MILHFVDDTIFFSNISRFDANVNLETSGQTDFACMQGFALPQVGFADHWKACQVIGVLLCSAQYLKRAMLQSAAIIVA